MSPTHFVTRLLAAARFASHVSLCFSLKREKKKSQAFLIRKLLQTAITALFVAERAPFRDRMASSPNI